MWLRALNLYILSNTFGLQQWLVSPISLNEEENLILENYKEASNEAGSFQDSSRVYTFCYGHQTDNLSCIWPILTRKVMAFPERRWVYILSARCWLIGTTKSLPESEPRVDPVNLDQGGRISSYMDCLPTWDCSVVKEFNTQARPWVKGLIWGWDTSDCLEKVMAHVKLSRYSNTLAIDCGGRKKQIENGNTKMGWLSNTEGPIFVYVPQRGWKNILFINRMKNVLLRKIPTVQKQSSS